MASRHLAVALSLTLVLLAIQQLSSGLEPNWRNSIQQIVIGAITGIFLQAGAKRALIWILGAISVVCGALFALLLLFKNDTVMHAIQTDGTLFIAVILTVTVAPVIFATLLAKGVIALPARPSAAADTDEGRRQARRLLVGEGVLLAAIAVTTIGLLMQRAPVVIERLIASASAATFLAADLILGVRRMINPDA